MELTERFEPADFIRLRDLFLAAQLVGNRREALRILIHEGLERGVSVGQLQLKVVQEAQREIGRLWQEGRVGIAQEHMATAISQLMLAHLYQLATAKPSNGKRVVVACVEGELHEFPARLSADTLELAGFEVRFLGADVPTESLLKLIAALKPDLVALSVTMPFNIPSLRTAVAQLREQSGGKVPIAVGGYACTWARSLAAQVGADATGTDADALLEAATALLAVH
jgi:methanogenic corrinoid protein MtbC1